MSATISPRPCPPLAFSAAHGHTRRLAAEVIRGGPGCITPRGASPATRRFDDAALAGGAAHEALPATASPRTCQPLAFAVPHGHTRRLVAEVISTPRGSIATPKQQHLDNAFLGGRCSPEARGVAVAASNPTNVVSSVLSAAQLWMLRAMFATWAGKVHRKLSKEVPRSDVELRQRLDEAEWRMRVSQHAEIAKRERCVLLTEQELAAQGAAKSAAARCHALEEAVEALQADVRAARQRSLAERRTSRQELDSLEMAEAAQLAKVSQLMYRAEASETELHHTQQELQSQQRAAQLQLKCATAAQSQDLLAKLQAQSEEANQARSELRLHQQLSEQQLRKAKVAHATLWEQMGTARQDAQAAETEIAQLRAEMGAVKNRAAVIDAERRSLSLQSQASIEEMAQMRLEVSTLQQQVAVTDAERRALAHESQAHIEEVQRLEAVAASARRQVRGIELVKGPAFEVGQRKDDVQAAQQLSTVWLEVWREMSQLHTQLAAAGEQAQLMASRASSELEAGSAAAAQQQLHSMTQVVALQQQVIDAREVLQDAEMKTWERAAASLHEAQVVLSGDGSTGPPLDLKDDEQAVDALAEGAAGTTELAGPASIRARRQRWSARTPRTQAEASAHARAAWAKVLWRQRMAENLRSCLRGWQAAAASNRHHESCVTSAKAQEVLQEEVCEERSKWSELQGRLQDMTEQLIGVQEDASLAVSRSGQIEAELLAEGEYSQGLREALQMEELKALQNQEASSSEIADLLDHVARCGQSEESAEVVCAKVKAELSEARSAFAEEAVVASSADHLQDAKHLADPSDHVPRASQATICAAPSWGLRRASAAVANRDRNRLYRNPATRPRTIAAHFGAGAAARQGQQSDESPSSASDTRLVSQPTPPGGAYGRPTVWQEQIPGRRSPGSCAPAASTRSSRQGALRLLELVMVTWQQEMWRRSDIEAYVSFRLTDQLEPWLHLIFVGWRGETRRRHHLARSARVGLARTQMVLLADVVELWRERSKIGRAASRRSAARRRVEALLQEGIRLQLHLLLRAWVDFTHGDSLAGGSCGRGSGKAAGWSKLAVLLVQASRPKRVAPLWQFWERKSKQLATLQGAALQSRRPRALLSVALHAWDAFARHRRHCRASVMDHGWAVQVREEVLRRAWLAWQRSGLRSWQANRSAKVVMRSFEAALLSLVFRHWGRCCFGPQLARLQQRMDLQEQRHEVYFWQRQSLVQNNLRRLFIEQDTELAGITLHAWRSRARTTASVARLAEAAICNQQVEAAQLAVLRCAVLAWHDLAMAEERGSHRLAADRLRKEVLLRLALLSWRAAVRKCARTMRVISATPRGDGQSTGLQTPRTQSSPSHTAPTPVPLLPQLRASSPIPALTPRSCRSSQASEQGWFHGVSWAVETTTWTHDARACVLLLRATMALWRHTVKCTRLAQWRWTVRGIELLRLVMDCWQLAVAETRSSPGCTDIPASSASISTMAHSSSTQAIGSVRRPLSARSPVSKEYRGTIQYAPGEAVTPRLSVQRIVDALEDRHLRRRAVSLGSYHLSQPPRSARQARSCARSASSGNVASARHSTGGDGFHIRPASARSKVVRERVGGGLMPRAPPHGLAAAAKSQPAPHTTVSLQELKGLREKHLHYKSSPWKPTMSLPTEQTPLLGETISLIQSPPRLHTAEDEMLNAPYRDSGHAALQEAGL